MPTGASAPNIVESYSYQGLNTVVGETLPMAGGNSLTMTDTLNSLGEVGQQDWVQQRPNGTWDQQDVRYGYTADGSVRYASNVIFPYLSEFYEYNALGQIKLFQRGTLNVSDTGMASTIAESTTTYSYNGLANLLSITTGGVNPADVLYQFGDGGGGVSVGSSGDVPTVANGTGDAVALTYDAWGRLVGASFNNTGVNGMNGTETLRYDALGRLIVTGDSGVVLSLEDHQTRDIYYDADGNDIEETNSAGQATAEYVFSPATGQMILRNSAGAASAPGDLDQTLYALTDPRGNITAITDDTGSVVERYVYDPTGNVQALSSSGGERTVDTSAGSTAPIEAVYDRPERDMLAGNPLSLGGSAYGWDFYWGGQRLLPISGLYIGQGGRAYDSRLGQFQQPPSRSSPVDQGSYAYTDDQLNNGWWSNFGGAGKSKCVWRCRNAGIGLGGLDWRRCPDGGGGRADGGRRRCGPGSQCRWRRSAAWPIWDTRAMRDTRNTAASAAR